MTQLLMFNGSYPRLRGTTGGSFHRRVYVRGEGVPQSWPGGRGTPDLAMGVPQSRRGEVPPIQDRTGVPPSPPREQQSEHLLHSGWYAS